MKWIRERDALIAQTLSFVQSVTGRKDVVLQPETPAAGTPISMDLIAMMAVTADIEAPQEPPSPRSTPPALPWASGDFRIEMQARIANFRKHQERFEREREEYCAATLTKLRAALRDASGRPVKK